MDLLASRTVRQLARDLVETPETETSRLPLMAKPGQDDYEGTEATRVKIEELRALVEGTRTDLGLGLPVPPGSLLGKLLAWPYQ